MTPQQLKKALVAAGFEVYRTLGEDIVLADRVRENLIMDSGIRLRSGDALQVRIVLRAQQGDFPGEEAGDLYDRVRALAKPAMAMGFSEVGAASTNVADPSDSAHILDTFCEVTFAKDVGGLDAALEELRFLLGLDKTVHR